MDKKKTYLNIVVGVSFKILLLFVTLFSRKLLIQFIGNEANGLVSLFTSIIGILSVAELGVGTAISFCMYKPIVEHNDEKVAALYNFFKKTYYVIGLIILIVGLSLTPLIPYLAKDYSLNSNIYISYVIQLCSVCVSYIYSSQISLINAYKNNYITTTLNSIATILKCFLQILVLYIFNSFYMYLSVAFVTETLQIVFLSIYTRKKYANITTKNTIKIDCETKNDVIKNVKAIFFHKIGALVVNSIDSIVISIFLGVSILGYYSNYVTVVNAVIGIGTMFFNQVGSIIGHSFYKSNNDIFKKRFTLFYFFNYFLGSALFFCYYKCIPPFISLFFGEELLMPDSVLLVITINYFIQFLLQAVRLFKDSTGLYYYDRYKCVIEAVLNLSLSILFVFLFGVTGVIVATIITNLVICHIVEPYVLYKHAFHEKTTKFYFVNYFLIALFICLLFVCDYSIKIETSSYYLDFVLSGLYGVAFSLPSALIFIISVKRKGVFNR